MCFFLLFPRSQPQHTNHLDGVNERTLRQLHMQFFSHVQRVCMVWAYECELYVCIDTRSFYLTHLQRSAIDDDEIFNSLL